MPTRGDADAVSKRLVEAANEAGGRDNISVVFVAGPDAAYLTGMTFMVEGGMTTLP